MLARWPSAMDELQQIRTQRDTRRLNCAVYQADLHATPDESLQLRALKHAVRLGDVPLTDAIAAVNGLRTAQQARRAA